MNEEIKLKYIGRGAAIPGIPARDLTIGEVKEHGGVVELVKTGLYERVTEAGAPPELIHIKGIGPERAKELDKIGVRNFASLILFDPDEIAGKLDGVSAETVSDWQAQAMDLMEKKEQVEASELTQESEGK